eukprot:SAG31_NODE_9794_length_1226_cov_1.275954_2_plen_275_part_00
MHAVQEIFLTLTGIDLASDDQIDIKVPELISLDLFEFDAEWLATSPTKAQISALVNLKMSFFKNTPVAVDFGINRRIVIKFDPSYIADLAKDIFNEGMSKIAEIAETVGKALSDATSAIGDSVEDFGNKALEFFDKAGDFAKDVVNSCKFIHGSCEVSCKSLKFWEDCDGGCTLPRIACSEVKFDLGRRLQTGEAPLFGGIRMPRAEPTVINGTLRVADPSSGKYYAKVNQTMSQIANEFHIDADRLVDRNQAYFNGGLTKWHRLHEGTVVFLR